MVAGILFPGQGSQSPGMADALAEDPVSAPVLAEASEVLGYDLVATCRDADALTRTEVVQPALLACEVGLFRILEDAGVAPVAMAGHSLGEYSALVAAGVIALGPALRTVRERSLAMAAAGQERPGTMLALLGLSREDAAALCADAAGDGVLVVANENGAKQLVISGDPEAIARAEELAKSRSGRAMRINVAGAFHSPLMEPARLRVAQALDALDFAPARCPIIPNVTATPTTDPATLAAALRVHVTSPVRWVETMEAMVGLGADVFIECGPGDVLTKLAKREAPGVVGVASRTPQEARAAAVRAAS